MNTSIDWKRKLSSRKFWAAAASWLTANLGAFGLTDNITARIALVITGVGALCVYMLAEAITDGANKTNASPGDPGNAPVMPTDEAFADALSELL